MSDISGGRKGVEIAWPLVYRGFGFVRPDGGRPEGDGEAFR